MGYQLTTDGSCVIRLSDGAFIPCDASNADYQNYLAWVAAGNVPTPAPILTIPELAGDLEQGVQAWLDTTAQANGYSGMDSCVSYLNSAVVQWADDAKAGLAWRDAVWQECYALQANPQLQSNPPTLQELLTQLPQPSAYGWVVHAPGATA